MEPNHKKITMNNKGQALMETLMAAPVLILWNSGLFVLFYYLLAHHWCHHWTYRSAICLAQNSPPPTCEQFLHQRLRLLVPAYSVTAFWRTPRQIHTEIVIFPKTVLQNTYSARIDLPLAPQGSL